MPSAVKKERCSSGKYVRMVDRKNALEWKEKNGGLTEIQETELENLKIELSNSGYPQSATSKI